MNLFDLQRPKLPVSERLQYTFAGRPVAAIPVLDVEPEPDGSFIISAMLKVDANSFVWHHAYVGGNLELGEFFRMWVENPEYVMEYKFHYKGPMSQKKRIPDPEHHRAPKMFDKLQSQEATIVDFEDL